MTSKASWAWVATALCVLTGVIVLLFASKDFGAESNKSQSAPVITKKAADPKPPPSPAKTTVGSPQESANPPSPPSSKDGEKPASTRPTIIIQRRGGPGAVEDSQSADTFLQFDTNRDGMVDRNEASTSEFLSSSFEAIDIDRNGKLTLDEMRIFDEKRKPK